MKKKHFTLLLIIIGFYNAFAQCFTKIYSGYYHIVATKSNNSLWSWGFGDWGQLGNSSSFDEYSPFVMDSSFNWQLVSCGSYNTFGIKTDGTLWGTGNNTYGALGINSFVNTVNALTQIGTSTNWKQVSGSGYFTLGTKTDNTLWGWGQNNSYQMGNATCCNDRLSPGQIGTATDWKLAVACTSTPVGLALKLDGTLWGWGGNGSGLIGESNVSSRSVPTLLSPDTDWDTLAVGAAHALALKTDGTLWAWGVGYNGQTGDNLTPLYFRSSPRQIGTDTWSYIACGFQQSFAIKSDGTLWAWGRNDAGQLGDGTTIERRLPVQIGTDSDWVAVAAGYQHGVALKSNGALYTWGTNDFGQLGNGSTTPQPLPTYIPVTGCALGTNDIEESIFALHPNPAKEFVTIDYKGLEGTNTLEVYELSGRLLQTQPIAATAGSMELPTRAYPSGVYVVVIRNEKGILAQQKLVVQ
ncbi:MAG: T9SS type A sorting domain-containing protein [Flavobacteriaceae bacterium]